MNDDPSGQAAESAHCATDARHQGETKPQAHLIVHATQTTTRRRILQARPSSFHCWRSIGARWAAESVTAQVLRAKR